MVPKKQKMTNRPRLLLDVCCGPCSTHVINELKKEHDITLFFPNSNIHPIEEFEKRLIEAKKVATLVFILTF